jgi:LAGLIDADG DNA endonuclease family
MLENPKDQNTNLTTLSKELECIILGSILGDGSLFKSIGNKNAKFAFRHSIVQKEYFYWKAKSLAEISSPKSIQIQKPDGYSKNVKLLFTSKSLNSLTILYEKIKNGKEYLLKDEWLNGLTPISLMIWWCDDGSLISNWRKGVLCTDGFDENFVKKLVLYLKNVWKIKSSCRFMKRKSRLLESGNYSKDGYFRIWFENSELKNFFRIIIPYVPVKEMIYKFLFVYKDKRFQKSWISEVKSLIDENLSYFVDEEMDRKLKKVKIFDI